MEDTISIKACEYGLELIQKHLKYTPSQTSAVEYAFVDVYCYQSYCPNKDEDYYFYEDVIKYLSEYKKQLIEKL